MPEKRISPEAVDALLRYPWPGNVREIENVIERILVLSDHEPMGLEDLPEHVRVGRVETSSIQQQVLRQEKTLTDAVDEFEREIIRAALQHVEFNQTRAADLLGHDAPHPQVPDGQARDSVGRLSLRRPARRSPDELDGARSILDVRRQTLIARGVPADQPNRR